MKRAKRRKRIFWRYVDHGVTVISSSLLSQEMAIDVLRLIKTRTENMQRNFIAISGNGNDSC